MLYAYVTRWPCAVSPTTPTGECIVETPVPGGSDPGDIKWNEHKAACRSAIIQHPFQAPA